MHGLEYPQAFEKPLHALAETRTHGRRYSFLWVPVQVVLEYPRVVAHANP